MIFKSNINREIVRLAAPVIVGMISHTVLNIVDTAMVGRLGDVALGAVGLGSFFALVTVLVFGSLNIGTQAVTSRRLGERKEDQYSIIFFNSFLLSLAIGLVISVIGYFLSPWIFSLLSKRPEIVSEGAPYLRIRFIGLFSMIAIFTMRGFVYGLARARIDMVLSVLINVLNIVLNYFLIFGHWIFPRLEVRGAAIASTISTVAGLIVYIIIVYIRIIRPLPTEHFRLRLSRTMMNLIIRISAPRAVQSISIVGFIIFLSLVGRIGISELAISNIIYKAFNLSFMIGLSIGTASATLVGRSLGEGNEKAAARYGWHSVGLGAIAMGVIGVIFMLFPRQIMGVFTDSAGTIEKGVVPFRILGAFQILDGVGIILSRTLQGAGSTLYVMVAEMIAIWIVMIPFCYTAVEVLGGDLLLAWWSLFFYIIFFTAAVTWKFKEGGWKKIKI
jgi:putative MATE family efflux protein